MKLKFNRENVVNLDVPYVPLFVISLGNTFGFPVRPNEICKEEFELALLKIGNEIAEYGTLRKWKVGAKRLMRMISMNKFKGNKFQNSSKQKFIKKQFMKTVEYLKKNPDVFISQADKGGKVVIMSRKFYEGKMNGFLTDCVERKTYELCDSMNVIDVGGLVEGKYEELRFKLNPYLLKDRQMNFSGLCCDLNFKPYVIPRIYGNIKVHKESLPVRPIVSSIDCQGRSLMEWLLSKLELIARKFNGCKIESAMRLFAELNGKVLLKEFELITWDYDDMYTNIPVKVAKIIIRENYHLIAESTSVPVDVFLETVSFFAEVSTYFLYNSKIYRQCKGLAMGNALSKILAEIVTRSRMNDAI